MCEHLNPWLALPSQPPYVLQCDSDTISGYSAKAKEDYKFHLNVLPEPFIGFPKAPVVLLNLNPGFDDRDPEAHKRPDFQGLLRRNYGHGSSDFPFFFLDPCLTDTPGVEWWESKLKWLLEDFNRMQRARSLLCVEYFPYHSRRFRWAKKLKVDSQHYGFGLVRSAIDRKAVIVIMRARRLWIERVPELDKYSRTFTLNSPQNVVVSPGNCAGFDVLVDAICDGKAHV